MSENLFRFLLSELGMIRVRCLHCKSVVEVATDQLKATFKGDHCPVCRHPLSGATESPFTLLQEALTNFKANADRVEIEFALPSKDKAVSS